MMRGLGWLGGRRGVVGERVGLGRLWGGMIEIKSLAQIHTYSDNQCMGVVFHWTTEKNHQLVEQRGVSFESVVSAIEQGGLLDVLEHPNQDRYPGQNIYVVEILGYVHLVPFVTEADGLRFLKTITHSRKATRDYSRERRS